MKYPSFVLMHPKQSMENTLHPLFINEVNLKCYPNVERKTVRDETWHKGKGPLVITSDAGPSHLCKDIAHVDFQDDLLTRSSQHAWPPT